MFLMDEVGSQAIGEIIAGEFDMLLGRQTYDIEIRDDPFATYKR